MIVGINALYFLPGAVGGTEIYLRELLRALARIDQENRYVVFTNRETGHDLIPSFENWLQCPIHVAAENRPARILYEQAVLPSRIAREKIDVLLNPGYTGPFWPGVPAVTVFHDLQHVKLPEHFKQLDLFFWRLLLGQAAKRSAKLIAVSEATRNDVVEHYKLPPDKVVVIHHGVEEEFFHLEHVTQEERFILCVSTLHPHKNLERLLRAFATLRERDNCLHLVLAGMRGFHTSRVEEVVEELKLKEAVTLTGWVTREQLYDLYATASAFVYPSTFEGFGMPILEAMAAGLPVACSSLAPHREIAGNSVLFFDPLDERAIAMALKAVLKNDRLAEDLKRRGPQRAMQFSWDATARKTLGVLRGLFTVYKRDGN